MPNLPTILVVCTANVCRSVYAANLLSEGARRIGVAVRSAGLAATDNQEPCELVAQRLLDRSGVSLTHRSHRLTAGDLQSSALVLTMTTGQRGEVNRLWWGGRTRTFTLIEAGAIARGLEGVRSFNEFVALLDERRSLVPMPSAPRRANNWLRPPPPGPQINIEDGHVSTRRGQHVETLNQIEDVVQNLIRSTEGALR